jgi:PRTRC genetic system ThiF family protein
MIHHIESSLLTRPVKVILVGAGGTGSHVLRRLAIMHMAMTELGHPGGLDVKVVDPDYVSKTNVGRQSFYPSDIGFPKAEILVHRCNMMLNTFWEASIATVDATSYLDCDILIGCVDKRKSRKAILSAIKHGLWNRRSSYYLDFGNREHDGQVILGQVFGNKNEESESNVRLPHAADLFPDIVDGSLDDKDETPSCSLAEALEKQSLFINDTCANAGMNMLWELFRYGQLKHHGQFINIKSGRITSLPIDPETWERMGYKKLPKRKRKAEKMA